MTWFKQSKPNHGLPCISSKRSFAYHQFRRNCISSSRRNTRRGVMIYTCGDDIPTCVGWYTKPATWIKKERSCCFVLFLVGVRRFERPTSWSRTKRSTKLSHTPKNKYKIEMKIFPKRKAREQALLRLVLRTPMHKFVLANHTSQRLVFLETHLQTEPHPENCLGKAL